MRSIEPIQTGFIRELAATPGPCITIALRGNDVGDTTIELKNAAQELRKQLGARGGDAAFLLDPAIAAAERERGDTRSRGGIVVLRSPSILQVHRAPSVRPVARVADRFDLRTLLAIAGSSRSFYILALSQSRTRILRCTLSDSEELQLPEGFAQSLPEFRQTRKPDHVLDNRASGGPSMGVGAVVFGTTSEREHKDDDRYHFFVQIDRAVQQLLKGSREPLVIAGVEHEIALYRRVNTYENTVEPGVHGAPDGLTGGEMHRRALEILDECMAKPVIDAEEFDKKVGTGHASVHIQEIVAAAFEGRVSHLFFQDNARYMGTYDPIRQRVKHKDDPLDSPEDLVELAGYQTLLQSGEVRLMPGGAMPNGVPVCALFRYPAAQSVPAEPVETATT